MSGTSRKRGIGKPGGSPFAKSLRTARDLIQSGSREDALTLLDRLARENRNPTRHCKIALLVGDSEASLFRHTEAAAAYAKAGQLARQTGDATLALRAGTAEIRSLLRSLRIDEAKAAAHLLLQDLTKAQQDFDTLANLTPEQLARLGPITLPARPPRTTVALTDIATTFAESGLTAEARIYLEKATIFSPNGAARARQLLARIALAADEPELAERHARESLQMGRFQAKTIAAWPLYLDARARLNRSPILEPILLEALFSHAKGRILCASGLSIAHTLRTHRDPVWMDISQRLLSVSPDIGDPVILTEIEKILLAEAKLTLSEHPRQIAERALGLFEADNVTPPEQVAHAKTYVRFTFASGEIPDVPKITRAASTRFGVDHSIAVQHAAALAAKLARKYEFARDLLTALTDRVIAGSEAWGRATWALASMESTIPGRKTQAGELYLKLAADERTPPRFRIQAMLRGFGNLVESDLPVDVSRVSGVVRDILGGVKDYRLALDAARQLSLGGPEFASLENEAAVRGKALALSAIAESEDPKETLVVIEYLSRRQYWDLDDAASVASTWDGLSVALKAELKLTGGSRWYEYVAVVFRSLIKVGREAEAVSLVSGIVDKDASTGEGYVIVGNSYSLWLMSKGRMAEAFVFFTWISTEAPSHRSAAPSHYWLGLKNRATGSPSESARHFRSVRSCFAGRPSLYAEWILDCSALLLLGDPDLLKETEGMYDASFREKASGQILMDEDLLQSLS